MQSDVERKRFSAGYFFFALTALVDFLTGFAAAFTAGFAVVLAGAAFFGAAPALFLTALVPFFSTFASVVTFFADLDDFFPPKIASQFEAYFSFVPTRVMVTESPFEKSSIHKT